MTLPDRIIEHGKVQTVNDQVCWQDGASWLKCCCCLLKILPDMRRVLTFSFSWGAALGGWTYHWSYCISGLTAIRQGHAKLWCLTPYLWLAVCKQEISISVNFCPLACTVDEDKKRGWSVGILTQAKNSFRVFCQRSGFLGLVSRVLATSTKNEDKNEVSSP